MRLDDETFREETFQKIGDSEILKLNDVDQVDGTVVNDDDDDVGQLNDSANGVDVEYDVEIRNIVDRRSSEGANYNNTLTNRLLWMP